MIEESKIIDPAKLAVDDKPLNEALERLSFIMDKVKLNLVNVFRLDNEEDSHDIEMSILRAFLKSNI